MTFVDRSGRLAALTAAAPGSLELGCGPAKRSADAIGVDLLDHPNVDVLGDVVSVLASLPDASVRSVYSAHLLEHLPDLDAVFAQLSRVLTDQGTFEVLVPHFSNPYFYSDPTHVRAFGLYTFSYLADAPMLTRKVPRYGKDDALEVTSLRLGFASPWPVRGLLRKVVAFFANLSDYTREFYEENLVYVVPVYEVAAVLRRRPR